MSSSSSLILTSSGKRDISTVLSAIIWFSNHALVFICHFPHLWITVAIFSLTSRLRSRHTYRTLALRYFAPSQWYIYRTQRGKMSVFHFPFLRGNDGYSDIEFPELQVNTKNGKKLGNNMGYGYPWWHGNVLNIIR